MQTIHSQPGEETPADGMGQLLRSILFTSYLFLSTPVFSLVIVLLCWLPYRQRYRLAVGWAKSVLWVLKGLCKLDYRVEGWENLPQDNQISMWKHSSSWETISQMVIFPPQAWVLKHELMWIPIVGWAIKLMKPIAIDRGSGRVAVNHVIEQGKQRLADGMWVLVFPEGTRVAAGTTRRYGVSGALLATQTGRKIIPVAHDAGEFWPRRGLIKRPGVIRVIIGPAIDAAGRDVRTVNEDVQRWIEAKLQELR